VLCAGDILGEKGGGVFAAGRCAAFQQEVRSLREAVRFSLLGSRTLCRHLTGDILGRKRRRRACGGQMCDFSAGSAKPAGSRVF